jgi:hypothetical protein
MGAVCLSGVGEMGNGGPVSPRRGWLGNEEVSAHHPSEPEMAAEIWNQYDFDRNVKKAREGMTGTMARIIAVEYWTGAN